MLLLIVIFGVIFLIYAQDRQSEQYINQKSIQESIRKVISHGGSIDEIRHIYDTRKMETLPLIPDDDEKFLYSHYKGDVALSHILADLLVIYYETNMSVSDSIYIHRLKEVVQEYNAIHPFDGLEESQKYYLENIRQKLGTNYSLIQDDLIKVGDELDRKNQLVSKYLNKSEISFWISIMAVGITIIFSIWQLMQNQKTSENIKKSLVEYKKTQKNEDSKNRTAENNV